MKKLTFDLIKTDSESKARAGIVHTDHGDIETPIFMPVGTRGSVKAVEQRELDEAGAQIILGNTYHLYLRPGNEIMSKMGGLHKFNAWEKPILTDSGGFQVFSLSELRKLTEEGVKFQSHIDGSYHMFTPESVVKTQRIIGSDIMMVLDECTPYPCDYVYAKKSNEVTLRWAKRCQVEVENSEPLYGHHQALFPIVQGSVYKDLRKISAETLVEMDFEGYAIGGLAVGEPAAEMYEISDFVTDILPKEKPRYLMGVGTPQNILESISHGIDMFDCVMPTRNGRNAMVFTRNGILNLKNLKHATDKTPVDSECDCYGCKTFSRGYLRHLFQVEEILALQMASLHNVTFYLWLVKEARRRILDGSFVSWKNEMVGKLGIRL